MLRNAAHFWHAQELRSWRAKNEVLLHVETRKGFNSSENTAFWHIETREGFDTPHSGPPGTPLPGPLFLFSKTTQNLNP